NHYEGNKPSVCAMLLMGCLFDSCGPGKVTRERFYVRRYSCPIGSLKNVFYLNCATADLGPPKDILWPYRNWRHCVLAWRRSEVVLGPNGLANVSSRYRLI